MPPRDSRAKSHMKVKGAVNPSFVASGLRVLAKVRETKVRDRACSPEFEVRPDPTLIPLYGLLIKDPVALLDLEEGLRSGNISNAEALSERFLRMVKNAKSFNRPGSTIYKDANRLLESFQTAMLREMRFNVENDEDTDEEEAWSRDLKERSQFASYERDQYLEVQAQVAKKRASAKARTSAQIAAAQAYDAFVDSKLDIKICRDPANLKKEINRDELIKGIVSLRLVNDRRDYSAVSHRTKDCLVCNTPEEETEQSSQGKALGIVVVTPKYHLIAPVEKKPSTPRPTTATFLAPTEIEPVTGNKAKKRAVSETQYIPAKNAKHVAPTPEHQLRRRHRRMIVSGGH